MQYGGSLNFNVLIYNRKLYAMSGRNQKMGVEIYDILEKTWEATDPPTSATRFLDMDDSYKHREATYLKKRQHCFIF